MKPIPKPLFWNAYSFSKKISIYKKYLGKEYSAYIDKLSAKDIAISYGIKVAPLVRVLKDVDDVTQDDLKSGYLLKASHGSGWNIFLNETQSIEEIKTKLKNWNKPYNKYNELQYNFITPKFFIEEQIVDKYLKRSGSLVYMIRCIYGNPIPNVRVRYNQKVNSYNFAWKPIEKFELDIKIEKPKHLTEMINYAKGMSKQFEFVRMDFFIDENDDIYFSEYTFTPGAGTSMNSQMLEIVESSYWKSFKDKNI